MLRTKGERESEGFVEERTQGHGTSSGIYVQSESEKATFYEHIVKNLGFSLFEVICFTKLYK